MKKDLPEDDLIDSALLSRIVRRQLRAWLLIGPALFVTLAALGLLLVPQSFTATTSVAVQQPLSSSSALTLLSASPQTKRYLGVIKSRTAALFVERRVHLQQAYRFSTREDALDFLTKHVVPEDNTADGLLYIAVTLPGPPTLAPGGGARRQEVQHLAAQAANAYADALRDYYVNTDTEQGTVLLRGADVETRKARAAYDVASARLGAFVTTFSGYDPRATPGTGGLDADAASDAAGPAGPAASETARLYDALAQVQAQIRAAEAAQVTQQRLVGGQLYALPEVPGEDPLLTAARAQVTRDAASLADLRIALGEDNPQVVVARQRLRIDQTTLDAQVRGVQNNLTTEHVRSAADLESLRAREATLQAQAAQAASRLRVNRRLSLEFARRQTELILRLDALRATMAEAAKVRLDNVSAASRMSVVDEAVPDRRGSPKMSVLAGISLALVILGFVLAVLREYRRQSRSSRTPVPGLPGHVNGAQAGVGGISSDIHEPAPQTPGRLA